MLKWAVNGSATTRANIAWQEHNHNHNYNHNHSHNPNGGNNSKLSAHQITSSTPLHEPAAGKLMMSSTFPTQQQMLESVGLPDLSRITTLTSLHTPIKRTPTATKISRNCKNNNNKNENKNYAKTLPTFDVEYSPCGMLISGPMLALRGIEIPDAYFEKPRYLEAPQHQTTTTTSTNTNTNTQIHKHKSASTTTTTTTLTSSIFPEMPLKSNKEQNRLLLQAKASQNYTRCSTEMSDVTLEHMIDAILENTCKDVFPRTTHASHHQTCVGMSPTYTRAEDPASDLPDVDDVVDDDDEAIATAMANTTAGVDVYLASPTPQLKLKFQPCGTVSLFREREVCSPKLSCVRCEDNNNNHTNNTTNTNNSSSNGSFQLKRQRAVRRKSKSRQKLRARKLLRLGRKTKKTSANAIEPNRANKKNANSLSMNATAANEHISPDSGRDSSSSLEDVCGTLEATKRRLSFSNSHTS